MQKSTAKTLLKAAIALYVISFIVINWTMVSWLFNYREMEGLVSGFFNPYPSVAQADSDNGIDFYPNNGSTVATVANAEFSYTTQPDSLDIPSIGLTTPIVIPTTTDATALESDLDNGVVYYPGSVAPGQVGQAVILGHSAPPGWPEIKHDWVFTNLQQLKAGDQIIVNMGGKAYTYVVINSKVVQQGDDVTMQNNTTQNDLTLVSCWPPGKDQERLAVYAQLLTK
jgi:sortase A